MPDEQLSDWWPRARAFLLDQLIVGGVAAVVAFSVAQLVHDPGKQTGTILLYAIALPIGFLYAPLLMARGGAHNGQTLGKQAVGIRVVRTDGAPVGFWLGVLRTVVAQQLLTAITFYAYAVVDYLWPLRDPQNQALHDKIAKTWVVRAPAAGAAPPPPAWPDAASAFPPADPDEVPVQGWLPPRAPSG